MSEDHQGASLPEGIEVDEAAAYFGVFESSDALHKMMEMSREDSLELFLELLSDLVLKPGEFDFEEASVRLSCEGGEIYFLVAGHLGIMTIPEQLNLALSEGQFSKQENEKLEKIADPMRLLKMLAIANQTGGKGEATKYLVGIESLMSNPAANKDGLLQLAKEFDESFDVAGHVTPISSLASGDAKASAVEAADVPSPIVEAKTDLEEPNVITPKVESKPSSVPLPESEPESIPLPKSEPEVKSEPESIPLPKEEKIVPLPQIAEPEIVIDSRKESEKAEDAFAGAFNLVEFEENSESENSVVEVDDFEIESEDEKIDPSEETEQNLESSEELEIGLEEAFAAADVDNSGGLSVEEVAEATGLDLDEAAKLHSEADIDGDGQVTLEELKSKPEVAEKMSLPKPVKPIRSEISKKPQQQNQPVQQQQWNQPVQPMPQQQWNQPVQPIQPTIRSGIHCRGCRIGVDPNWRFCPICGTQNR